MLNRHAPLDAWPHLKRVRRLLPVTCDAPKTAPATLQVILGSTAVLPDPSAVCTALAEAGVHVTQTIEVPVPKHAPITASQFQTWKQLWPITFHPPAPYAVHVVLRSAMACHTNASVSSGPDWRRWLARQANG